MRFVYLLALPALLIGGSATAQNNREPYRAVGTEPFWALTIDGRTIRLAEPGRRDVLVARPVARPSFNGERYLARGMTIDVTHAPCSDGMSDRTYHDTVTVRLARRTLRGCGGRAEERSRLADTRWTVWTINGREAHTAKPLTLAFSADGRVDGKFCNNFGGRYRLTGEQLRVDDLAGTQMACRDPSLAAETTLFRMLRASVKATVSRWNTLILSGGGDTITLRPAQR